MNLPAGCSDNVNPTLLLDAFEQSAGFTADAVSLLRPYPDGERRGFCLAFAGLLA
ncbi:MAG: hypothetical protein ACLSAP_03555 [Oscillospiraceae bacterium]